MIRVESAKRLLTSVVERVWRDVLTEVVSRKREVSIAPARRNRQKEKTADDLAGGVVMNFRHVMVSVE